MRAVGGPLSFLIAKDFRRMWSVQKSTRFCPEASQSSETLPGLCTIHFQGLSWEETALESLIPRSGKSELQNCEKTSVPGKIFLFFFFFLFLGSCAPRARPHLETGPVARISVRSDLRGNPVGR